MAPEIQGFLIDSIAEDSGRLDHVLDPFMGGGTILREAMARGIAFTGQDINPLSLLLCKVEAGPFHVPLVKRKAHALRVAIQNDRSRVVTPKFKDWMKWFRCDIAIQLSRIRRQICAEKALWVRRFFWRALAETIRVVSNSRMTTFKLHIRPSQEIIERRIDAIACFDLTLQRHFDEYARTAEELSRLGYIARGQYQQDIHLAHANTSRLIVRRATPGIVVTSPPYGDNPTTVPYGQHSHLPLQWIPLRDIDRKLPIEWSRSGHFIDRMSLGGNQSNALAWNAGLEARSPTFWRLVRSYAGNKHHERRLSAFFRDLSASLLNIHQAVARGGHIVLTLGNRRIGGREVPLAEIVAEILASEGVAHEETWLREIPLKRMARRNASGQTMLVERTLVFAKA